MNQVPIKLGPLALLLTVISICVTTLAILTFTTAEADRRLADRFAGTVKVRYDLETKGQEFLGQLSDALEKKDQVFLDQHKTDQADVYECIIEEDNASLTVRAKDGKGKLSILSWKVIHSWEEDKDVNIWNGSW